MKYCKKCGTLLEDGYKNCIGCGRDVVSAFNYSNYPPEIEKDLMEKRSNNMKRNTIVISIVLVSIALLWFISILVKFGRFKDTETTPEEVSQVGQVIVEDMDIKKEAKENKASLNKDEVMSTNQQVEVLESTVVPILESEEIKSADENIKEPSDEKAPLTLNDYKEDIVRDSTGTEIFKASVPYKFTSKSNYESDFYSDKFPITLTYYAYDDRYQAKFSYLSARHYYYQKSSIKDPLESVRDIKKYNTYLKFTSVESYLKSLIKNSYVNSYKLSDITLLNSKSIDDEREEKIEKLYNDYLEAELSDTGFGKISKDCVYSFDKGGYEAKLYTFTGLNEEGNTIYFQFYVPLIYVSMNYNSKSEGDNGTIMEWFPLALYSFEAMEEITYDKYKDAFIEFINNSSVTDSFMKANYLYSQDIDLGIENLGSVEALTDDMLNKYNNEEVELPIIYNN